MELVNKWPKKLPELTAEQLRIKDDFMKHWHEILPKRYGIVEKFNHTYPLRRSSARSRVLEIGAGLGEHIGWEEWQRLEYWALELRPEMAAVIRKRYPGVRVIEGDCQQPINIGNSYFDRVIAIHVLEHLPNLPVTIQEMRRVLNPDGELIVVIPCEGGMAYSIARHISAKRIFERRYRTSYDWCIGSEHINKPAEITEELSKHFNITDATYFPLKVHSISLNLIIGLTLKPQPSCREEQK